MQFLELCGLQEPNFYVNKNYMVLPLCLAKNPTSPHSKNEPRRFKCKYKLPSVLHLMDDAFWNKTIFPCLIFKQLPKLGVQGQAVLTGAQPTAGAARSATPQCHPSVLLPLHQGTACGDGHGQLRADGLRISWIGRDHHSPTPVPVQHDHPQKSPHGLGHCWNASWTVRLLLWPLP